MFQINVQSSSVMSQSKEIQCCGEKVPKREVLESSQDKNLPKVT